MFSGNSVIASDKKIKKQLNMPILALGGCPLGRFQNNLDQQLPSAAKMLKMEIKKTTVSHEEYLVTSGPGGKAN